VPRLAFVKSLRTLLPIHFHVSLDSDHRYAERLDDFFRLHTSGHDHLTGEHAETPHVRFLMLKHRQVTVHITHLSLFGFNGDPTVNLRHTGWKDWQLHLWHAFSYQPLATYATIFRLILISSTTRKSPASSGGLKVSLLVAFLLDELDVHIRITGCRLRIGGDDVYRRLRDNLDHLIDVPECFAEFVPKFL